MKTWHIVYNIIALIIVGVLLLSSLSTIFLLIPTAPKDSRNVFIFVVVLQMIVIILLGAGAMLTFAKKKFSGLGAGMMIAGYSISIWLIPFAIWGGIALARSRKEIGVDN